MGNLLFSSKKKNAKEQLEDIQNEIDNIETSKLTLFVQQKNFIALLYFLFILIYPTGLGYIYFTFDRNDKPTLLYSAVFIVFLPILVYFTRKMIQIYYKWSTENNNIRLVQLIKKKKHILSKVQETETFNDAKSILEKYDPSLLRNLSFSLNNLSSLESPSLCKSRQISPINNSTRCVSQILNNRSSHNRMSSGSLPPLSNRNYLPQSSAQSIFSIPQRPPAPDQSSPMVGLRRTIKPILPQNRSTVEKLIDYMFNDGPNNRYALICSNCLSHNGMALPDEFDYISYICAYCGTFNKSRKARPMAPQQPKAIEATPESTSKPLSNSINSDNLKIVELSSELNKTSGTIIKSPHIEELEDQEDLENEYSEDGKYPIIKDQEGNNKANSSNRCDS